MKNPSAKIMLLAVGLTLFLSAGAAAQFQYAETEFSDPKAFLLVDYAYFRGADSGTARLELYYQIHHSGLTFSNSGASLIAAYAMSIRVEDDDGNVMETFERDRQVVLGADESSRTRTDYRSSQVTLEVPVGKYRAVFSLMDKTSGAKVEKELKIKIERLYHQSPQLSEIEFLQAFERDSLSSSVFAKGDMVVVPAVHRVYGSLDVDRVAYYFEIYPGYDDMEKVVVETKIRHYRRGMQYRDTLHLDLTDSVHRQLREISLAEFLPGLYELEISLLGRRDKRLAGRSDQFTIAWTEEGMIRNDWKATIQQLKLYSEDVDVDDIEDLETYAERLQAFQQFWSERDPTDGTEENEAKIAFYYRVGVANERFGIMKRDGWRTDRGQIYIRYGEPDYLTDEPFALDVMPYQIWHYVNLIPVRNFLFIDEKGDGDFRLQYPYDGIGTSYGY